MKHFATENANRGPQFPLLVYDWMYQEEGEAYKTAGSPIAEEAWQILQEYSKAFPQSDKAYLYMASMQANFGNKEAAIAYAKKAVELSPSASTRNAYAYQLYTLRQTDQSIAELKAAITLSPDTPLYWDWLGRNYFTVKARNLPLAIECFTRAIELGGDSRWLPVDRGRSYMILGDIKAAIPNFQFATRRWPNFDQAFYHLGTALYRDGDREGAQRAFNRAIELNEKNKATIERFLKQQNK